MNQTKQHNEKRRTLNSNITTLKCLDQQVHCYNHIFPKQQINNLIHLTFIPYYETIMGTKRTKQQDFHITEQRQA
jgi:hypothetical protein